MVGGGSSERDCSAEIDVLNSQQMSCAVAEAWRSYWLVAGDGDCTHCDLYPMHGSTSRLQGIWKSKQPAAKEDEDGGEEEEDGGAASDGTSDGGEVDPRR